VTATWWQWSTVPASYQDRVAVIHEGIDTSSICSADKPVSLSLQKAGLNLRSGDPVVIFVNRNLEPYRGFHVFMRILPILQRLNPNVQVVIVGAEGVSYGQQAPGGKSWKQHFYMFLVTDLTEAGSISLVVFPIRCCIAFFKSALVMCICRIPLFLVGVC
tara:strand:- start:8 stop:487 length:480 start_codon:yes stop_codon:yes gene_type:complete